MKFYNAAVSGTSGSKFIKGISYCAIVLATFWKMVGGNYQAYIVPYLTRSHGMETC